MTPSRIGLFTLLATAALGAWAQDSGYLCCNLRTDGAWISDSNYAESGKTTVPFGTPVKVLGQGRQRVHIEIGGKRMAIGNDYSRDLALDVFQRRYIVPDDPRPMVAALPPRIRAAIESFRVTRGMTRGQVAIALGWPISSETPHLDARVWKYWLWTFSPFDVQFDGNGLVTGVDTDPDTRRVVWMD